MIFVFNGNGDLLNKIPEKVYQGSNRASRIFFFAPFVENAFVDVAFTLPNGELRPKRLMSRLENVTTFDGLQIDGQNVGGWVYDLPQAITLFAGTVKVQFFVTNGGETISTENAEFFVEKGVPPIQPEDDDNSYEYVIEVVSQIITEINNLNQAVASFKLLFDENFPNSISENTYKDIHEILSSGNKQVVLMGANINNNTFEYVYGFIYAYDVSDSPLTDESGEVGRTYSYSIYLTINGIGYWSAFEYYEYDEGKGTSSIYVITPLSTSPTKLEKTIPNIKVVTLANFPDEFNFDDSITLGDLMSGIYNGENIIPPDTVIIKNNSGVKGVVVSYEPDEFPRATVIVGNYLYTYILGGFEDPNIGWFSKQEIGDVTDIKINEQSIVENGVANIPIAEQNKAGVVYAKLASGQGITIDSEALSVVPANNNTISAKSSYRQPIVPVYLDYAVKVGVTTNTITLTDGEQQSAQEWLGVKKLYKHRLSLISDDALHNITLFSYATVSTAIPFTQIETISKLFSGAVAIDSNTGNVVVFDNLTSTGDGLYAFFTMSVNTASLQFKINTTITQETTVITEI